MSTVGAHEQPCSRAERTSIRAASPLQYSKASCSAVPSVLIIWQLQIATACNAHMFWPRKKEPNVTAAAASAAAACSRMSITQRRSTQASIHESCSGYIRESRELVSTPMLAMYIRCGCYMESNQTAAAAAAAVANPRSRWASSIDKV